jgi:hypothetical protein
VCVFVCVCVNACVCECVCVYVCESVCVGECGRSCDPVSYSKCEGEKQLAARSIRSPSQLITAQFQ